MPIVATALSMLLAMLVAYLLGSIPVATLVSRHRGVDISSAGTGLAGAANVLRTVGRGHGAVVFLGDAAKGILAIIAARRLGIEGDLVLLPAFTALAGHWRSIFNGFRGGDGLSTLVGIIVASLSLWAAAAIAFGVFTAFIARLRGRHGSLWGGFAAYGAIVAAAPFIGEDLSMVLGIVALGLMVLAHGMVGHRRRRWAAVANEFPEDDESEPGEL